MIIANPIYDVVFKRLMENERVEDEQEAYRLLEVISENRRKELEKIIKEKDEQLVKKDEQLV